VNVLVFIQRPRSKLIRRFGVFGTLKGFDVSIDSPKLLLFAIEFEIRIIFNHGSYNGIPEMMEQSAFVLVEFWHLISVGRSSCAYKASCKWYSPRSCSRSENSTTFSKHRSVVCICVGILRDASVAPVLIDTTTFAADEKAEHECECVKWLMVMPAPSLVLLCRAEKKYPRTRRAPKTEARSQLKDDRDAHRII
jgi:hypothetical protein